MRTRLLAVVILALALIGGAVALPPAATAYRTYACEDNGFPREIGVAESPGRVFFVGTEHTTPLEEPNIVGGARLCFEVNDGASNVVGIDVGFGLWRTSMLSGPGLAVYLDVCGHPTEGTCNRVLQPTGIDITPADLPSSVGLTTTCIAEVGSFCIQSPKVVYGSSGDPTLVILVNGVAVPVNLTSNCITFPGIPCD